MKKRKLKPKFVKYGQRILCFLCAFLLVTVGVISWLPIKAAAEGTNIFFEDFENEDLSSLETQGWQFIDSDGDGFCWFHHTNTGSLNHKAHSGDSVLSSQSFDKDSWSPLTPTNWAITPPISINSYAELSFWIIGQDSSWADEHLEVYIAEKNGDSFSVSDFFG